MKTALLFRSSVVLTLLTGSAFGAVLYTDTFSFVGALTDNGWTAHSGAGNRQIMSDGDRATLTQEAGSGEDLSGSLPVLGAGGILYVGFDVILPSGQTVDPDADGNYFVHLRDSGNSFRSRVFVVSPAGAGDFGLAFDADSSTPSVTWGNDLVFDTNYRVVFSYDFDSGDGQLWLNPTNQASPSLLDVTGTAGTAIEAIALRQSNDFTGQQSLDNLRVATTFNEALVVPEPSIIGFLSLSALMLARSRRRQIL